MQRGRPKEFDRDQALERAMEVFWQTGYEAAGLSELTGAMGIGRQSLYDTFGCKRALYLEAIERYGATQVGTVAAQLEAPGSPLGNLLEVLAGWQTQASRPCSQGCLVGNALAELGGRDPEIDTVLRRQLGRLETALRQTLERAHEAGELKAAARPEELARFLMAVSQAMSLLGKVGVEPEVIASVAEVAERVLTG